MSLTNKEKELVAVGISVAAGCKPCTNYHFKKACETGASEEEIKQAISDAVSVRNNTTDMMGGFAFSLLDATAPPHEESIDISDAPKIQKLIFLGAAFAVNCAVSLEKHIAAYRSGAIPEDEIKSILDMAQFIKGKGASHVDHIAEKVGRSTSSKEKVSDNDCSKL